MKRLLILCTAVILLVCSGCAMTGDGKMAAGDRHDTGITDADLLTRGS